MTKKQWLERAFYLNEEIEQLKIAKELAKKLNDDAGGNTSEYKEYTRMLFKKIDELLNISKEITEAISKVENPTYRTLLTARYINFKKWTEVAEDMEIDLRWMYRLRKRAMEELKI